MQDDPQYLSVDSLENLKKEYELLKVKTLPEIAKRIDEAKQQGDLSENAEYHQAREDMSWAKGRMDELESIINNAQIITKSSQKQGKINVGSTIDIKVGDNERKYTIVGQQEANPSKGLISNESPLGRAFLGHEAGDEVDVVVPAGKQTYHIIKVS
ncbi:MAG: transcription elongation factor GreA [Candidatus Magasanikbacteria bacterium]